MVVIREVPFAELVFGIHQLSGVSFGEEPAEYGEVANTIVFKLDDRLYRGIEDPSDGYRSYFGQLAEVEDVELDTEFPPQPVIGVLGDDQTFSGITFNDPITNQPVLVLGTDNYDDYYPCFVASFTPENMAVNQGK